MYYNIPIMNIIIDDREKAVIPFFESVKNNKNNIKYKVSRINYGDYSINYGNNIIFIIERKTWKDLSQSIKDGRKDNINRLIELRDNTNCKIFYLIEGNPLPKSTKKFCRISYKNLRAHLDHIMIRDNIHIIHSKNQENTVERIYEMINNYLSIKPNPLIYYDNKEGGLQNKSVETVLKQKNIPSESSIIYKIWSCIPGVTEKTACLFINNNFHISDLLLGNISKDTIYSLKYNTGFIIGKRSDKIWKSSRLTEIDDPDIKNNKILKNNKYFINMLSQIKGITKKTAGIILENIQFKDLLNNNIISDVLINIKLSEKRKLGKKKSDLIIKFFSK